jgi:hypothetical protein
VAREQHGHPDFGKYPQNQEQPKKGKTNLVFLFPIAAITVDAQFPSLCTVIFRSQRFPQNNTKLSQNKVNVFGPFCKPREDVADGCRVAVVYHTPEVDTEI